MNIFKATADFERWLAKRLPVVRQDIALKHGHMAEAAFAFFRATFYRWLQLWPEVCPELAKAPSVLAVGDLHIENFGTWRDEEGRLIWGINDFDEAYPLPYPNDLVRLATGANMAITTNHLRLNLSEACKTILAGYTKGLSKAGKAFVLEENHPALRAMALSRLRDPVLFWQKLDSQLSPVESVPASVRKILKQSLPASGAIDRIARRQAGQGSLGRDRFVALARL